MMNAKSFNIILCPNYFCKLGSVIFSLKLRNNQKKTGNVLIFGSSITRDINTKTLKKNVTVNIEVVQLRLSRNILKI